MSTQPLEPPNDGVVHSDIQHLFEPSWIERYMEITEDLLQTSGFPEAAQEKRTLRPARKRVVEIDVKKS